MKRSTLVFLFIAIQTFCFAQTINQRNKKGQRQGIWLIYLNKKWKEVKDTNTATFKTYQLFKKGKQNFGSIGNFTIKERLNRSTDSTCKFLNGTYNWYNKKDRLKYMYTFTNGQMLTYTDYSHDGSTNLINYQLMYKDDIYTYTMQYYNAKKQGNHFFLFKDGYKGWCFYEWDANDPNITKRP